MEIVIILPQICWETDNPSVEEEWEARPIYGYKNKYIQKNVTFYFQAFNESKQPDSKCTYKALSYLSTL